MKFAKVDGRSSSHSGDFCVLLSNRDLVKLDLVNVGGPESFTAGFKLAAGIAKELEEGGAHSFDSEVEE